MPDHLYHNNRPIRLLKTVTSKAPGILSSQRVNHCNSPVRWKFKCVGDMSRAAGTRGGRQLRGREWKKPTNSKIAGGWVIKELEQEFGGGSEGSAARRGWKG